MLQEFFNKKFYYLPKTLAPLNQHCLGYIRTCFPTFPEFIYNDIYVSAPFTAEKEEIVTKFVGQYTKICFYSPNSHQKHQPEAQ